MLRLTGLAFLAVVGIVLGTAGCGGQGNYKTKEELKAGKGGHGHDHDHGHPSGPHGGTLVELGKDEYHAEVVLDQKGHTLKVYLLGGDGKTTTPVAATEVKLTTEGSKEAIVLKAKPQEGEADGKTSLFELADEKLVHNLADAGFIHGTLAITIGEKSFKGDVDAHFAEEAHTHDAPAKKEDAKPADQPTDTKAAPEKPSPETPAEEKPKAAN